MASETATSSAARPVPEGAPREPVRGPEWLTRRVFGRIMLICGWLDLFLLLILVHLLFFY